MLVRLWQTTRQSSDNVTGTRILFGRKDGGTGNKLGVDRQRGGDKKGVPFRDAHGIVGQLVLHCLDKGIALDDMSLEEYKAISPVFENDIYEAISLKTCVEKRLTLGAPGPEAMKNVIAIYDEYIANN